MCSATTAGLRQQFFFKLDIWCDGILQSSGQGEQAPKWGIRAKSKVELCSLGSPIFLFAENPIESLLFTG